MGQAALPEYALEEFNRANQQVLQIIEFLKDAQVGVLAKDMCRKHGFSDAAFYGWRAKFGGMQVEGADRLGVIQIPSKSLQHDLALCLAALQQGMGTLEVFRVDAPEMLADGRANYTRIDELCGFREQLVLRDHVACAE